MSVHLCSFVCSMDCSIVPYSSCIYASCVLLQQNIIVPFSYPIIKCKICDRNKKAVLN